MGRATTDFPKEVRRGSQPRTHIRSVAAAVVVPGPRRGRNRCDASSQRLTQAPTPATPYSASITASTDTTPRPPTSGLRVAHRTHGPEGAVDAVVRRPSSPKGAFRLDLGAHQRWTPLACVPSPYATLRAGHPLAPKLLQRGTLVRLLRTSRSLVPLAAHPMWLRRAASAGTLPRSPKETGFGVAVLDLLAP